jgi:hypothetical protein
VKVVMQQIVSTSKHITIYTLCKLGIRNMATMQILRLFHRNLTLADPLTYVGRQIIHKKMTQK